MLTQQNTNAIAQNKNFALVAEKIDELNAGEIEIALKKGELYRQQRQRLSVAGFKLWLNQNGFTFAIAAKYMNLAKTFGKFSPQCIGKIALSTLFALCQPKYKKLVSKLRGFAWTEAKIATAMQQEREIYQALKPKEAPKTGLKSVPTGGRAYQFPLLHNDEAIAKLLKLLKNRNITPVQLLVLAIANLFEQTLGDGRKQLYTGNRETSANNGRGIQKAKGAIATLNSC